MQLLPYLDHLQNPRSAGALVEVRLQQNSAVVIHQVTPGCGQILRSPIDQLGAVIRIHLRQVCKVFSNICNAVALNLGVIENLDDLVQSGNLTIVEAAMRKGG